MRIAVLSGGVGGARFLQGLLHHLSDSEGHQVTVIANTGDDTWMHGLKVCPDLDTVMYTLGDGIDTERGWGHANETWSVMEELRAYGVEPTWFNLGDRDVATHLVRSQLLQSGYPLSEVTAALCDRWLRGRYGDLLRLVPMTDERVETHIAIDDETSASGTRVLHFQEYWVRLRAEVPARAVLPIGIEAAKPAPGVVEAISEADVVLLPPSNPIVSVGMILRVPGIRDAVRASRGKVIGLSPIVAGSHVRGMANQLLEASGIEVSAHGVALDYAARSGGGILDGWLVDSRDSASVPIVTGSGIACEAVPLMMTDIPATATMARAALALAGH